MNTTITGKHRVRVIDFVNNTKACNELREELDSFSLIAPSRREKRKRFYRLQGNKSSSDWKVLKQIRTIYNWVLSGNLGFLCFCFDTHMVFSRKLAPHNTRIKLEPSRSFVLFLTCGRLVGSNRSCYRLLAVWTLCMFGNCDNKAKECEAVARNWAVTRLCTCVSCNGQGRSFQAVKTNTSPSSSEQPNK